MSFSLHLTFALLSVLYISDVLSDGIPVCGMKQFYVEKEQVTPPQATDLCAKKGMLLASVQNQEENKALLAVIQAEGTSGSYWTAGRRRANEEWKWWDSEPIEWFNWGKDEPNSKKKDTVCLELYVNNNNLFWNDHYCSKKRKYICEKFEKNEDGAL